MTQLDKYLGTLKVAKGFALAAAAIYALIIAWKVVTSGLTDHERLVSAGNLLSHFLGWWLLFVVSKTIIGIVHELKTTV